MAKPSKETLDQWHQDPSNWKLGFFYFNPADKRLLPPKRMKALGYTVNFANPLSILLMIATGVAAVLLMKMMFGK